MIDPKELFLIEHDRLIADYMEAHPHVSEADACERTADAADAIVRDTFADMVDRACTRHKERTHAM